MSQEMPLSVFSSRFVARGGLILNLTVEGLWKVVRRLSARDRELPEDGPELGGKPVLNGVKDDEVEFNRQWTSRLRPVRLRKTIPLTRIASATRVFHGMAEVLDDPNNNRADKGGADKCYSLRPRSERKRDDDGDDEAIVTWKKRPKKRSKPKPQPLSKYRRKTANARERSRMREINEAFDSLRRAVPHSTCDSSGEKLTKISTLRLAMKYISALSAALQEPPPSHDTDLVGTLPPICLLPPTPPISDSPLSPPPEISPFTEMHAEIQDFDPFASTALDLEDFFFT